MNLLLASLPILLILILMIVLRWNASRAGIAGWVVALLIAAIRFGAGTQLLGYAHLKSLLLGLDVLWIIWNAFLLYQVTEQAGAVRMLSDAIPGITGDRGMQALLIGWVFASFLQGVGGFGVPTAITAPILIGLGFPPIAAVAMPSLGHAWSVTFGSLGSSFQALQSASDIAWQDLAPYSALLLAVACLGCGLVVAHIAGGWSSIRRLSLRILVMAIVMGGTQYLLAVSGLWVVAGLGGGSAGLAAGLLLATSRQKTGARPSWKPDRQFALAISGYVALVIITLVIQSPPVFNHLDVLVIQADFPEMITRLGFVTAGGPGRQIYLLRHAGTILAYASLVTFWLYRRAGMLEAGSGMAIIISTIKRMLPSSVGILALVSMAVVMNHAGMTDALAHGIASSVAIAYPFFAPFIGALGAFMTGSNTNSNVVFTQLQMRTADLIGYGVPLILAAQTTGGALGSVIAPTKIIVGTATAGLHGLEGEVLRRMSVYTILLISLIGVITWIGVS